MELIGDSQYGRFVGSQFDLNRRVKYQEEVLLVVRATVSEQTVRGTRSGTSREINVLSAKEVQVIDEPESSRVRELLGIVGADVTPDLGQPVTRKPLTPVVTSPQTTVEPSEPKSEEKKLVKPDPTVVGDRQVVGMPHSTRDKVLAKFLGSIEEL